MSRDAGGKTKHFKSLVPAKRTQAARVTDHSSSHLSKPSLKSVTIKQNEHDSSLPACQMSFPLGEVMQPDNMLFVFSGNVSSGRKTYVSLYIHTHTNTRAAIKPAFCICRPKTDTLLHANETMFIITAEAK